MTAIEYLSQYSEAVKDLKTKRDELEALLTDATATAAPTGETSHTAGNVSDKVGKGAAAIADIKREIEEEREVLRLLRRDIRSTISHVHRGDLRRLLTYRYICGCSFERVAVKMNYSYFHVVHRLHPRALAAIGDTFGKSPKTSN